LDEKIKFLQNSLLTDHDNEINKNLDLALARIDELEKYWQELKKVIPNDINNCQNEYKKLIENIDELQDQITSVRHTYAVINEHDNSIRALEKSTNENFRSKYEIQENLSKRIASIEEKQKFLETNWEKINRLEKEIEIAVADYDDEFNILKEINIDERLNKIEKWISNLAPYYGKPHAKKPYKCPTCHGNGTFKLESLEEVMVNDGKNIKICVGCEGKGIVWG
jgi:archaellum component FlaC